MARAQPQPFSSHFDTRFTLSRDAVRDTFRMPSDSLPAALAKLASYRINNTRASQETFDKGAILLKSNVANNMGDDGWAFLEQMTLASIDVGRLDVAERCLNMLVEKFPESPRVECLAGILIEATRPPETALAYYEGLLQADSANAAAWKRQISVLRRMGKPEKAASELCTFLDTFYTDLEGWLELADIYASCNLYPASLQALSHALLLAPQNPFHMQRAAETAYTAGDVPLALKTFLIVIDMTADGAETVSEGDVPSGLAVRAWFGVKLCTGRLLEARSNSLPSASHTEPPKPEHLKLVDELAREQLKIVYSSSVSEKAGNGVPMGRDEVFAWLK